MKKSLKSVLIVLLCASLLLLAACTKAPTTNTPADNSNSTENKPADTAPQPDSEGKTYVIRIACDDEAVRAENVQRAADRLTEQLAAEGSKDVVTTEYIVVTREELPNNMAMWNQTGDLPELICRSYRDMVTFAEAGFLAEADNVAASEAYQKVYSNLLELGKHNGHYYGLIQDSDARPVWINKNHLKALGWTDAQINELPGKVERGEFTQKDLQVLAKEVVDKGISEWGIMHRPTWGAEFINMHVINGAVPFKDGKVAIQRSAMKNFLTFLRENVENGLCPAEITTFGWDPIEGDLQPNQKTFCWYGVISNKYDLMTVAGVSPEFVDETFILTLPPVANVGDRPVTLISPLFYCMTTAVDADPKMREYTERVLQIVLDPDIQMHSTVETYHMAITPEIAAYPEYQENTFLATYSYLMEYATLLQGSDSLHGIFYADDFFAAVQATEMSDKSIDTIVDEFISNVTYKIGEGNYILED